MMPLPSHTETEAIHLVTGGVAQDIAEAREMLQQRYERKRKADVLFIYSDVVLRRQLASDRGIKLLDEMSYNHSTNMTAFINGGYLSRLKTMEEECKDKEPAFGKLAEFVSRDGQDAKLVSFVEFPYEDKNRIYLSPYSIEFIRARGGMGRDERENMYRIEYSPINGDFPLGMFKAWQEHPVNDEAYLVLWIPKNKAIII